MGFWSLFSEYVKWSPALIILVCVISMRGEVVEYLVPFHKRFLSFFSFIFAFVFLVLTPARASDLPKFFTYLKAVDPSILQEIRYYGSHNFLGRPVKGYRAAECILTIQAARALKRVQQRLRPKGLSLKVYDCYRPQRAVNDFIAWAKKPNDQKTKEEFYPTLKKSRLFGLGYIARRSTHSRGSTVDLTIVPLPPKEQPKHDFSKQRACFEDVDERFADNSLDFGTGYDCFHKKSHTKSPVVFDARKNRDLLVREMAAVGFENYRKEWWHFSLKNEPYKRTHFDFPITPYKPDDLTLNSSESKKDIFTKSDKENYEPRVQVMDQKDVKAEYLRVVCVASDDVLNVRRSAHHKAQIIAALPSDAVDIAYRDCLGDFPLKEWHGLDAIARKTVPAPWCYILSYKLQSGGSSIEAKGWVSGAFVAGDFQHRLCPHGR